MNETENLIKLGNYLLSDERYDSIEAMHDELVNEGLNPVPAGDSHRVVHHADIENWKEVQNV